MTVYGHPYITWSDHGRAAARVPTHVPVVPNIDHVISGPAIVSGTQIICGLTPGAEYRPALCGANAI